MHIYYSVVDPYPAYRADLAELFAVELHKLGLQTEWFMAASADQVGAAAVYSGQVVHRPRGASGQPRILAKINYWLADLYGLSRLAFRKVDAIQCRDKYVASLAALMVARISHVPFFYWCSYPFPEHDRLVAQTKAGWRRLLGQLKAGVRFFLLYKVICRFADHVFVQSTRMQNDMHGYGIARDKMTPVPMGVSACMSDWISKHPVPAVPFRIVYLGSLASVRRLDMLLDAFLLVKQQVPDAQLMFVGDGDHPSERQMLVQKTAALGLGASVVFSGFVPKEEAWSLCASASVCVSPIFPVPVLASASPTKLVEYLALGRPVVCNDHPEQTQIIKESGAGLCVEWSAVAFAGAITELLLNPDQAEAQASRGPAWVAANRSYPLIARRVWAKYCELIGSSK